MSQHQPREYTWAKMHENLLTVCYQLNKSCQQFLYCYQSKNSCQFSFIWQLPFSRFHVWSFSFSSRWHRNTRKGPYTLHPISQQSPQGCPRNSANIWLVLNTRSCHILNTRSWVPHTIQASIQYTAQHDWHPGPALSSSLVRGYP